MSVTRSLLALVAASALATGCQPEDKAGELANLQAELNPVIRDTVGLEANAQTRSPEAVGRGRVYPEDLGVTGQDVMDAMLNMAADEPCEIRGAVAGKYVDGRLLLAAVNPDLDLGVIAAQMSDLSPNMFLGGYRTRDGAAGTVQGKLRQPNEDEPLGSFTAGMKSSSGVQTVHHVFGVYLPDRDLNRTGRVLGAYAVCVDDDSAPPSP